MKTIIVTLSFFLLFIKTSFAKDCQVYGISDSPQKLSCHFKNYATVTLRCSKGEYLLQWGRSPHFEEVMVETAFHLEVEEGSNPLVFKSPMMTLTVVAREDDFTAKLTSSKANYSGTCR